MADNLPGRSGETGAGKPLTRREWAIRERQRKALDIYTETFNYGTVRKRMSLVSTDDARRLVQEAWERYEAEEDWAGALYRKAMREGLAELHVILMQAAREHDLGAIDRLLKVWERMAKLEALDRQKEEANVENNWTIIATPPWMRDAPPAAPETIEGEVVEDTTPPSEQP